MTERQLIEEHITELAEIVREARKLTQQEYEDWKNFVLNCATEKNIGFTKRVLSLAEQCLMDEKEGQ
jgi:hypothetical protein|nr:MAG TPA: hypothetical protein [Inoviridae sp.]